MKHYISLEQYLQQHQNSREGYDVDYLSRLIVKKYLESNQFTDIQFTTGNNATDITALHNNVKFAIEVKDRSYKYKSTDFNDHCCEIVKVQSLYKRKQAGEFERLCLFSMFLDSCLTITLDIDIDILRQGKMLFPKTTTLGDNELIEKDVVFYKQNKKVYFVLWWDDTDNILDIQFSSSPIDIDKLNREASQPVYTDVFSLM